MSTSDNLSDVECVFDEKPDDFLDPEGVSDEEPDPDPLRAFINWTNDNHPYTNLFSHPFHEMFIPYPFQTSSELSIFRTPTFAASLAAAFPSQVEEVYLYHCHSSRREKKHMVEIFVKILGGYLFYEDRAGGCGCRLPPGDHLRRRVYFGLKKEHIATVASVGMRRECWAFRAAEHRTGDCYGKLRTIMDEMGDTSEEVKENVKMESEKENAPEYTGIDCIDEILYRQAQEKITARMFKVYWQNRDIIQ